MKDTNLIGFDNEKYIREQTNSILERVNRLSHVNPELCARYKIHYSQNYQKISL